MEIAPYGALATELNLVHADFGCAVRPLWRSGRMPNCRITRFRVAALAP